MERALEAEDIHTSPDAYLRMLKYYPEDIEEYADIRDIAENCIAMIETRIAKGDQYSNKVLREAREILDKLD